MPLLAVVTGILGLLTLGLLGGVILVWNRGEARADQAAGKITADAQAWRDQWAASHSPAPKKGKKKAKAAAVTPALAGLPGPLPDGDVPLATLKSQNAALQDKLAGMTPDGLYIVIDTANNRFYMKRGQAVLEDTVCSTGSYSKLDAPDGRSWFFHTPRGKFKVQSKIKDPVWIQPDWAFIEKNEPVPGPRDPDRAEPYVMGDYALAFGNGYYIHGTLYTRLLGNSVTHGCVRLADGPLERVFNTAQVGTPIFIY